MKGNLVFSLFAVFTIAFIVVQSTELDGKPDGAPSGSTGSPGDDATCAQEDCHTGSAQAKEGLIFSNIPETGYIASETYTITVQIESPGRNTFGFQASPQNLDGGKMGVMIRTDEVETKFVGFQKYITHTLAGIDGENGKTWSFDWTPATAEGDVTFYVAVNSADGDEEATGDSIYINSITVAEDPANEPLSLEEFLFGWNVLLNNPVENNLQLQLQSFSGMVQVTIFDLSGQKIIMEVIPQSDNAQLQVSALPDGIYILYCSDGVKKFTTRFVKI